MAASSGPQAGNGAAAGPPGPVSFGFSRKAERRRVLAAGPCAEPGGGGGGGGDTDTDFLTAVEDRELLRWGTAHARAGVKPAVRMRGGGGVCRGVLLHMRSGVACTCA